MVNSKQNSNIQESSEIQEDNTFTDIRRIRKRLGFHSIAVFSRYYKDGFRNDHIEVDVQYYPRNTTTEEVELHLKELNKRKRTYFWHYTHIELTPEGLNQIINLAENREIKYMKMSILEKLNAEEYVKLVTYVNRNIHKEYMEND